jgi:hypothetical protein
MDNLDIILIIITVVVLIAMMGVGPALDGQGW